ncbi:group II intron reverse transcriptase/maturase [Pseudomonas veronii]
MVRTMGLAPSLLTQVRNRVRKLQRALYVKAKTEPDFRFYSLWDKVYRIDVLVIAYQRCRANRGSHGVDGQRFEDIENRGPMEWLAQLREELKSGGYRPQPLRRVWIPKKNGKLRSLGIPCIRDRVVQMAVNLTLQAIFEADMQPAQYGFRPRRDAKEAVRQVHHYTARVGLRDVVDTDLRDYFNTIPHGPLMKCLARRISDGRVLRLIKQWLEVAVIELIDGKLRRTNEAKHTHRGSAQGSVISPLLANVYFRRFILAWEKFGYAKRLHAKIVNYADDMVICCRPGSGEQAMVLMSGLMARLGLSVNEEKTALVKLSEKSLDFLGYNLGRQYDRHGKTYIGTQPSKGAMKSIIGKIHDETAISMTWDAVEHRIAELNSILRGWAGYFDQGPVLKHYRILQRYTERRIRRWLVKKHKRRGRSGYRLYPDAFLYGKLGLHQLPTRMADVSSAKAYRSRTKAGCVSSARPV